ncbi:MAG: nickel-responsive transcriptional regulator NikR [Methanomicrobia archaeon]|nr:nickel-responsive transcriptional regulator NikR [Methanomicrobia archaeon]
MEKMVRFGVSIPPELLKEFDELINKKGYANRSEAIRDIIRDYMIEQEWEKGEKVVGTITILYDHDTRGVMEKLTDLQHENFEDVSSTIHVHLDENNCLEVIIAKGDAKRVKKLADRLIATKGVKHGKLVMTSPLKL